MYKICGQAGEERVDVQFEGGMKFRKEGTVLEGAPTDSAGKFLFFSVICKSWITTQQVLPQLK